MQTLEWPIEDIIHAHPGLYLEHFALMAAALMSRLCEAPCKFFVECEGFSPPDLGGETEYVLGVAWDEQTKQPDPLLERVLDEASWLLSHAQVLAAYGRQDEASAELARAACWEEQAACLFVAAMQPREAAIHRVSSASCCEKLGQHARAVTLLGAALAVDLPGDCRARVEEQRARCATQAHKDLVRAFKMGKRKQAPSFP